MNERDRRLALIIIGMLLLIPLALALLTYVVGFVIDQFV